MWDSMIKLMNGTLATVGQAQQASIVAATQSMELAANTYARFWGLRPDEVIPSDNRFRDDAWRENLAADVMKQAYLITARWLVDMTDGLAEINPELYYRSRFWTQQMVNALSPSNFALTNPAVMQETIRTGGSNLVKGMQNLISDLQEGRISQVPAGSFQVGKDLAITPGKVIYRNPLIELIQYQPSMGKVREIPLLIVPPWINRFYVMDMRPENSMFKYLIEEGYTVFSISWKNPDASILDLEWSDYMDMGPLAAIDVIKSITGSEKVNAAGYCLGGIILQVTLAYMAAMGDESINAATFFTTHQDFKDAGDISVFISEPEVVFLEWLMKASGGYLDGRNMAATFNMLRSNDLLWNYVVDNYLMGKEPPAFDLLYWNADGTRVPGRVHSFLVREFFLKNKLMEPGGIKIKGVGIDLGKITVPSYVVAAENDHIVPWRGAYHIRRLHAGPVRFILSGGGHIAGIINPPAQNKRSYLTNDDPTEDPDTWQSGATTHHGSWWPDWTTWLGEYSGEEVAAPTAALQAGSDIYPPLMDAPGSYVLEK